MNSILSNFPFLTDTQKNQIVRFEELLREWNAKINLISRLEVEFIYDKHILHSLSIVKMFEFKQGTSIVDIGSGGGFPGIPLAIMFPSVNFTLVDSIKKKTFVLEDITRELNLNNTTVLNKRAENIKSKFDFVTGRAVEAFPGFYMHVRHLVSDKENNRARNGIIYLKGGDFSDELKNFKNAEVYNISDIFTNPFFETKRIIYLPIFK